MKNSNSLIKKICFILVLTTLFISCTSNKTKKTNEVNINEGLERLIQGNKRFTTNHSIHPDQTLEKLRELEKGQHPFAVIISCSDSRVPPELIFDQGFGDLFIIRNAGNIIGDYEIGSAEYAVEHLKTKLIVVMGHSNCGAISAYIEHKEDNIPNHIQSIVDYIKKGPEEIAVDKKNPDFYNESIKANVMHGVHILQNSDPTLKEFIEKKELKIIGAIYDIHTGKVSIISE